MQLLTKIILLLSLTFSLQAQDLKEFKLTNDSTAKLHILYLNPATQQVLCVDETGIIQSKSFSDFEKTHRTELIKETATNKNTRFDYTTKQSRFYEAPFMDEPKTFPPLPPKGWQLAPWNKNKRSHILSFNQSEYGNKSGACVPNSFLNTLEWWDDANIINIEQKRSREKQVDWLHTKLNRAANTRHQGTQWKDLASGLKEFCEKELKSKYHFAAYKIKNPNLEQLVRYTQGNTAVCLSLSVYSGSKYDSGHGVTLVSAKPNGELQINTWGLKLPAKFTDITDPKTPDHKRYELKILMSEELLPEWFVNQETRFIIDTKRVDHAYLFIPYQRQTPGIKFIPHPKIDTQETIDPKPLIDKKLAFHFEPPEDFHSFKLPSKELDTTWSSSEGKTIQAKLKNVSTESIAIIKNRKEFSLPKNSLTYESIQLAELWHASKGNFIQPRPQVFKYQLFRDNTLILNFEIKSDGKNYAIMTSKSGEFEYHLDQSQDKIAIYRKSDKQLALILAPNNAACRWDYRSMSKIPKFDMWKYALIEQFPSRVVTIPERHRKHPSSMAVSCQSAPLVTRLIHSVFSSSTVIDKEFLSKNSELSEFYNPPFQSRLPHSLETILGVTALIPVALEWHSDAHYGGKKFQLRLVGIEPAQTFKTKTTTP